MVFVHQESEVRIGREDLFGDLFGDLLLSNIPFPRPLCQVITNTPVPQTTTPLASSLIRDETMLRLPLSLFVNQTVLCTTLGLGTTDDILIYETDYLDCLLRYEVYHTDGCFYGEGKVPFALLTPEPACENTELTDVLLRAGLITPRFAACLTMTDFCNPTFSPRRAALLRYFPESVTASAMQSLAEVLETRFVEGVRAAHAGPDSPEAEFLRLWETEDWQNDFTRRIAAYLQCLKVAARLSTVVEGWFRLAESRRVHRYRKHTEFPQTPGLPALRMLPDGTVGTCQSG